MLLLIIIITCRSDGKYAWAPKIHLEKLNPDKIVLRREVVDKQVLENIHKSNIPIHEINSGMRLIYSYHYS